MRAHAVFVTVFLIFHHAVAILHGGVHTEIPVILTSFQNLFVTIVMMLLPIIAVTLTWTRYSKIGLLLLAICMLSSLLFDIYYHYILVSPDNISHLPIAPANVHLRFIWTAHTLAVLQLFGSVLSLSLWRKQIQKMHKVK